MVHDDAQFSTPVAQPFDPLLQDRTRPFPVNRVEISSDSEMGSQLIVYPVKTYSERYINVAKWLGLLTLAYLLNRIFGLLNVPYDIQHHTWLGHCRNLIDMFLMGFMQCWLVDLIDSKTRWGYLLKDAWFVTLFLVTGPCFSVLTTLPGFDQSLGEDVDMSAFFIAVLCITGVCLVAIFWWHVKFSKTTLQTSNDFMSFWFFRAAAVAVLMLSYHFIHSDLPTIDGAAQLHLHHYFLAWLLSTIAAFNHRFSATFLALTTAIFVQGLSVYSAASLFHRGSNELLCPETRVH